MRKDEFIRAVGRKSGIPKTPPAAFLDGMVGLFVGVATNIAANRLHDYYRRRQERDEAGADAKALAGDWERIGGDFLGAVHKMEQEQGQGVS